MERPNFIGLAIDLFNGELFLVKKLVIASSGILAFLILAAGLLLASPYYFYHKVVTENYRSKWYFLENYRPELVTPAPKVELKVPELGSEELWQNYHFKDTVIPLPVRNPLYYVAPIMSYDEKTKKSRLGMMIYGTGYREMSKIYFVNNMLMSSETRSQELFKLPLAKNIIQGTSEEKVWKDIFEKDLSDWNVAFSQMIYNLYLLQLRSKLFPEGMVSFSALDENTGIIKLKSPNKDYVHELVMTRTRGVVYSYLIVTEKNNNESELLRYKFLREISFRPGSESLAGIIYKEFKALPYEKKIGHQGMLFLLSAYSHQMDNKAFLKEMIFYLERGDFNQKQIRPLYEYAAKRYGKVFASALVKDLELSPEMALKRNIELEKQRNLEDLGADLPQAPVQLTPEERVEKRIEEAKKKQMIKRNRMIID